MNYNIFLFSIALFVGICFSENTAIKDTLVNKTALNKSTINQNDSFFTLGFEANVQSIKTSRLSNKLRPGVDYKQDGINDFIDTCEIIVGFDANYLVILKDIKFTENALKMKKPNCLFLRIHSPTMAFAEGPEIGKRYIFQIGYRIDNADNISFMDITASMKK